LSVEMYTLKYDSYMYNDTTPILEYRIPPGI